MLLLLIHRMVMNIMNIMMLVRSECFFIVPFYTLAYLGILFHHSQIYLVLYVAIYILYLF